jgi:hypothetical protein
LRNLLLIAAPLALAACAEEPAEVAPTAEDTVATEPLAMVTANGTAPGTFMVTAADGTTTTTILNEDGTYLDLAEDGSTVAEGSWSVVDDKTCFMPVTEGVETMCYSESEPGTDGSFTATPDEGEPVTVTPAGSDQPA